MASGVPFSLTCHRYDIAQNNVLWMKAQHSEWLRAIDEAGAAELSQNIGKNVRQPIVIHMGVDLPKGSTKLRAGALNPLRAVIAARFVEKKGHIYLIEAVHRLRNAGLHVQLDCVGDGPLRPMIQRRIKELRLEDRIVLRGTMSHGELLSKIAAGVWDVMVLPSIVALDGDREGIPVSLMEAMAYGLPVVSTNTGGIQELAGNGAGILVPEKDPVELANAMRQIADDEFMRRQLAERGRRKVFASFAADSVLDELERRMVASCATRGGAWQS